MRNALLVDPRPLPPYDLGPEHPWVVWRLRPLMELVDACGLVSSDELIVPAPATPEELGLAHDPGYVRVLHQTTAALDRPPPPADLLRRAATLGIGAGDNPLAPGQHRGAAAAVGGTVRCVEAVMEGRARRAFNPAGGLHHAMRDRASGFCLYNDLAVAIRRARTLGAERITYVDFDVHHGDGVEAAFADDPAVQTISFHEDPAVRFPFVSGRVGDRGRGDAVGTAINLPFASGTVDDDWQALVERTLETAVGSFRPDLLITQHGCDTHTTDPLADLSLTTRSADFAAALAGGLADRHCAGRWIATGGGGYRPVSVLARAWALVWARMAGRDRPDDVPESWRRAWQGRETGTKDLPRTFLDSDAVGADRRGPSAARRNDATFDRLARLHGW